ncbi:MAG: hypothetical protein HRU03_08365 [Nanoarchaeales archaeon]|nr:hypothetical protein [Nanoarchaeales archaeon]
MKNLPENTLIQQCVHYPSFNLQTNKYKLKYQIHQTGSTYIAATPKRDKSGNEVFEGSLVKDECQFKLYFPFGDGTRIGLGRESPTDLVELIRKEYIIDTNYKDFFKSIGFKYLEKEIEGIEERLTSIYVVTKKGHNVVGLDNYGCEELVNMYERI